MKKRMMILLVLLLVPVMTACRNAGGKDLGTGGNTVTDILEQGMAPTQTEPGAVPETTGESTVMAPSTDVDVDLTALSSTMVYSEVQNMLLSPEQYEGKSVRMNGDFAVAQGDDRMYYACIIRDATACCANGIEFVRQGDYSYPDDYPEVGSQITVVGKFDTYYEDGQMYLQLLNAQLSY